MSKNETEDQETIEVQNQNKNLQDKPDSSTNEDATTSKSSDEKKHAIKRNFLEVNDLEKYKPFMVKKPAIGKIEKQNDALSRAKHFLPMFADSTSKLLEKFKEAPDEINIENVDEEDEHIEMNVAVVSDNDSSDEDESEDEDEEEQEESNSDESPEENDENDDDNPIKQLDLGFKVKDPNRIKKLKLEKSPVKNTKKPLIKMIDPTNDDNESQSN